MNEKRMIINPARCSGCKTCELACSFSHLSRPGLPGISRIKAYTYSEDLSLVVVCLQCDEAACVKSCPSGALFLDEKTGAVAWEREKCVHCGMCAVACPFGNIGIDPANGEVLKCDLCGGDPICAKFCPTRALEFAREPGPPPSPLNLKRLPPLPWEIREKVKQK